MALELPPDLAERAERELNETPETRAAGLKTLHQYYAEHPNERPHRTDDPFLLMFLRHAKFDVAKARGRLAALERWIREAAVDLGDVTNLRGEMFKGMYSQKFMGILGQDRRTRDGAYISTLVPRNMEPLQDPTILLKWNVWMLYRAVHMPYLQVCGQVVLESFVGFSFLHAIRFQQVPTGIMRRNFRFMQEVLPLRLRGIWLVHPVKWISFLLAIARPFMSSKLKKRVRAFGGDLSELYQLIDPAVLPEEFGGRCTDCGEAWFEEELRREAAELAAARIAAGALSSSPSPVEAEQPQPPTALTPGSDS